MMTTEQGERLLGQIVLGVSSRTACDNLNILYCDLLSELDANEPYRHAYYSAMAQRDALNRALGKLPEEE